MSATLARKLASKYGSACAAPRRGTPVKTHTIRCSMCKTHHRICEEPKYADDDEEYRLDCEHCGHVYEDGEEQEDEHYDNDNVVNRTKCCRKTIPDGDFRCPQCLEFHDTDDFMHEVDGEWVYRCCQERLHPDGVITVDDDYLATVDDEFLKKSCK